MNAPGKLSLEPDRLSNVEQHVGAVVKGLAALDRMAGIDHLDKLPHEDLDFGVTTDCVQPHDRHYSPPHP